MLTFRPKSPAFRQLHAPENANGKSGRDETRVDWIGPICILLLSVMGVFFIYSAQAFMGSDYWTRQILWIVVGSVAYFIIARIDYKIFFENAQWVYLASLFLLLLLWTPLGEVRFDARRWIDLVFFSFQPSEGAKIGTLVLAATVLARSELSSIRESFALLLKVFIIVLIPILLIFWQPDLGSVLIFPPMIFSLLYVSKLSERFFLVVFAAFALGVGVVGSDIYRYHVFLQEHNLSAYDHRGAYEAQSWVPLRDYQRNRILAFVAPEIIDPKGISVSWNYRQSVQAVGTGGWSGKGWTMGTQAKLGYLPRSVAHNDFIFSVLAEELGFIGGVLVIGLFGVILGNGLRIAGLARDRFGMLLAVGVTVVFLVHIFINIGMTIGLMPITGLPLPFLSYGGSFILSCFILQGLVQSVYRHRREFS